MPNEPHPSRRGFSLVELVVSLSVMSILAGGMASAVLMASHAMPERAAPASKSVEPGDVLDQIAADLSLAIELVSADPSLVQFEVPDRGHGLVGAEAVEYGWSGSPGDPLTYRYNGGDSVDLCDDVHEFTVEYVAGARSLARTPRVLLAVDDAAALSALNQARMDLIASLGFSVVLLDDDSVQALSDAQNAVADVIYVSKDITPGTLGSQLREAPCGIVCEKRELFPDLGLASKSNWHWVDMSSVVDNTHEITSPFAVAPFQLFTTPGYSIYPFQSYAPGGRVLMNSLGYDQFLVVEAGGELLGGGGANARRVVMPWGDRDLDIGILTEDSKTIMRRAIVWAAAPMVVDEVRISLQIGSDVKDRVERTVDLLNQPEWP